MRFLVHDLVLISVMYLIHEPQHRQPRLACLPVVTALVALRLDEKCRIRVGRGRGVQLELAGTHTTMRSVAAADTVGTAVSVSSNLYGVSPL